MLVLDGLLWEQVSLFLVGGGGGQSRVKRFWLVLRLEIYWISDERGAKVARNNFPQIAYFLALF